MTIYELTYLASETEVFIDLLFNRWVQATFAVLVATYFSAGRINILFLKLMGVLYLGYSLAQVAALAFQISKLNDYIAELELITDDYAGNVLLSVPGGVLLMSVYIVGTLATLYFVRHTLKQGGASVAP